MKRIEKTPSLQTQSGRIPRVNEENLQIKKEKMRQKMKQLHLQGKN